jgi:hypothetical protein
MNKQRPETSVEEIRRRLAVLNRRGRLAFRAAVRSGKPIDAALTAGERATGLRP